MPIEDTDQLISLVRKFNPFEPFLLQMFFPSVILFETKYIDFDLVSNDLTLAPFVAPKVAGKVIENEGGILKKFSPAYIKPKHAVDPERVLERLPGEALNGNMSPGQRIDAIISANLLLERNSIIHRLEWMAAQVLLSGSITVEGEDYPTQVVNFGRDAGNTIQLSAGAAWDQATATPVSDLETWAATSEAPVTDIIMDQAAWGMFIGSVHAEADKVLKILNTDYRGSESSLKLDPDNGSYVQRKGNIGAMTVWVYAGFYHDQTRTKQNFIPANTVVMASRAIEGVRAFGAILNRSANYRAMEQFPRIWIDDNVNIEYTETQSAPLLIPKRPDASLAITVI